MDDNHFDNAEEIILEAELSQEDDDRMVCVDSLEHLEHFMLITDNSDDDAEHYSDIVSRFGDIDEPTQKRPKRRQIHTDKWARNKRMKNREQGVPYNGVRKESGNWNYEVKKNKREMKPSCNCKAGLTKKALQCRLCPDEARRKLHQDFWKLSWNEKKMYICALVDKKVTNRNRGRLIDDESRRQFSLSYHLRIENQRYHVCKTMFLNTFSIGEWSVRNWKLKEVINKADILPPKEEQRMLEISDRTVPLKKLLSTLAHMDYC